MGSDCISTPHLVREECGLRESQCAVDLAGDLLENARAYQAATENVVDAYRQNDLGLHVRVRVDVGKGEAHEYVAVFEALPRDDLGIGDCVGGSVYESVVEVFGGGDGGGVENAVAVFPAKLVEQNEAVAWSLVRLYFLDELPVLVGELLYPVLLSEVGLVREDRELDRVGLQVPFQRWVRADSEQRELIRQVVECRAGVIEERAERPREFGEQLGLSGWLDEAVEARLPVITVSLGPDGIRLRAGELFAEIGEGFSLAIRPFKAPPRIAKMIGDRVSVGYAPYPRRLGHESEATSS